MCTDPCQAKNQLNKWFVMHRSISMIKQGRDHVIEQNKAGAQYKWEHSVMIKETNDNFSRANVKAFS